MEARDDEREESRTIAAVAKALAGNHPPDIQKALFNIAAGAVERRKAALRVPVGEGEQ